MKLSYLTLLPFLALAPLQAESVTWYDEPALYEGPYLSFETYLKKAEDNLSDEDYEDAAEYFDSALEYLKVPANRAQALLLAAEAYNKDGSKHSAYKRYTSALEEYPQYVDYNDVLNKILQIAQETTKEEEEGSAFFRDLSKPITYYETVISNAPFSKFAPALMLRVARLQMKDDEEESAIATYRSIIKRHPYTLEAGESRFAIGVYFLKEYKGSGANLMSLIEAKKQFLFLNDEFQNHDKLAKSREYIKEIYNLEAKRYYQLGEFYLRKVHYRPTAAKDYLYKVVVSYKKSKYVEAATEILKHYDKGAFDKNVHKAKERAERMLAKQAILEVNKEAVTEVKAEEAKLPEQALDRSKRAIIISPKDSDRYLVPVENLNLNKEEKK